MKKAAKRVLIPVLRWYKGLRIRLAWRRASPVSATWKKDCDSLDLMYDFRDESSSDVRSLLKHDRSWRRSHFTNDFRLPVGGIDKLSYQVNRNDQGVRFHADNDGEHWIYLLSRNDMPDSYAIEFEYVPHSVFREQLQICFCARSLCDRHRFILKFNRQIYYQVVKNGFFLPKLDSKNLSLDLHRATVVRFEKCRDTFSISFDGKVALCEKCLALPPVRSRSMLLFWNRANGEMACQEIDFELRNFRFYRKADEA